MKDKRLQWLKGNESLILLIAFYLLTRFIYLKSLPIFNDEATYVDWAWRMVNLKGQFFYSLAHAKPPLFMWIVGIVRKVITDPLVAGRSISIIGGLLSVIGLYKIARYLFNKKAALLTFFLYTIVPIFIFYDRQALMESSVAASGVWSFYFFLKLMESKKYKYAVFLGITLGLGYLVKTNAILFFIPLAIFFIIEILKVKKDKDTKITNGIIIISTFSLIISPLLLNNIFWEKLGNNKDYIFTLSELAKFPVLSWIKNLKDFSIITLMYLNPLVIILAFASIYDILPALKSGGSLRRMTYQRSIHPRTEVRSFLECCYKSIKNRKIKRVYAITYLVTGWLFIIFLTRSAIPRHIVAFLPVLLIFTSDSLLRLFNIKKWFAIFALITTVIPALILSSMLIFSPIKYFYLLDSISAFSLKEEYVTYWSSGYGVEEVVSFLKGKSEKPIIVGVRLDAGIPENAVIAYFQGSDSVLTIYLDARMIKDFDSYDCIRSRVPVYFVSRDNQLAGLNKHLEEVKRVYKPEEKHYIGIHEIKTDCQGEKTLNLY